MCNKKKKQSTRGRKWHQRHCWDSWSLCLSHKCTDECGYRILTLLLLLLLLSLCLFQESEFLLTYGSFRHLVGLRGRGISPEPRPLPTQDNTTQRNTDTHIHAPSRIRTCDPNVRAAEDTTCPRPCGYWDFCKMNILFWSLVTISVFNKLETFRYYECLCKQTIGFFIFCLKGYCSTNNALIA
jgi:hypothetical protein